MRAQEYTKWSRQANRLPNSFFVDSGVCSAEHADEASGMQENAMLITALLNVLSSQLPSGAWPKNVNFFVEREQHPDDVLLGTVDNGATTTEIRFLCRYVEENKLYLKNNSLLPTSQSKGEKNEENKGDKSEELIKHNVFHTANKVMDAALKGINYLLDMQYANGGFPQYFPRKDFYHARITFNDNAMVNVMKLLREVSLKEYPYSFVPDSLAVRCTAAFQRGISCILKCQIVRDGYPTVWCQQHDEQTLAPAPARAYELASFCSSESVDIVELLMSLDNPSDSIRRAIHGAMAWFGSHAIHDLRRVDFTDSLGRRDFRMEKVSHASSSARGAAADARIEHPTLWSRYYDLETEKPFFCGRDSIPHDRIEDIEYERRTGYAWYVTSPKRLFEKYVEWKLKVGATQ